MSKLIFFITDICVEGDLFFKYNIYGNKLLLTGNPVGDMDIFTQLTFGLPVFFLLIIFGIWFVFGRDEKVIGPLDTYPPKGFNSAEMGFLYNGKADAEDVVSLLIFLANRGYIKITETSEKALFSTVNRFTITKLKDNDGDNLNEKMFMKGLFKLRTPLVSLKEVAEVTFHYSEDIFYYTLNTIKNN